MTFWLRSIPRSLTPGLLLTHAYDEACPWLRDLTLRYRRAVVVAIQLALIVAANYAAFLLRFDGHIPAAELERFRAALPWLVAIRSITFVPFRLYEGLWKYTGVSDVCNIVAGVAVSAVIAFVVLTTSQTVMVGYGRSILLIDSLVLILLLFGVRLSKRIVMWSAHSKAGKRVLIWGAGDAGEMIVRDMQARPCGYQAIGFIDDNGLKLWQRIHGVPVLGSRHHLARLIARMRPDEVLLAMPNAEPAAIREMWRLLRPFNLPIRTLPSVRDILDGRVAVNQIRDVTIGDLLSRAPVDLDVQSLRDLIGGRRVLITGAAGSIGSELSRQIASFGPAVLVLYERYENTLHDLSHELLARYGPTVVKPMIGDVTDAARVGQVFAAFRPELVFHAAAHKHVPLMEHNPCEAIKNNVVGTATVARAAAKAGVERFILISTDKAVSPSSVMGASKYIAERIVKRLSNGTTHFATVRFGNVLGSNGSVLPRFLEQIKAGGPVTVTHPDIRRYFMLIPEAVQLVLHAAALGEPGMTYVLEMGEQIRLVDLARDVIRLAGLVPDKDIQISFVGLRPGEKLFEELVGKDETAEASPIAKIQRVRTSAECDGKDFEAQLSMLVAVARDGNVERVIEQLRRMVPLFEPLDHPARRIAASAGRHSRSVAPASLARPKPSPSPARVARAAS